MGEEEEVCLDESTADQGDDAGPEGGVTTHNCRKVLGNDCDNETEEPGEEKDEADKCNGNFLSSPDQRSREAVRTGS